VSTLALAAVAVFGMSAVAHASGVPALSAEPTAITVGEETTVTATGLGGLETAYFGLDGTPGGVLIEPTTDQQVTNYEAPVENGQALVRFTATQPGTFTIAVGTGETVAATVAVTVTATESPSATPEPTMTIFETVAPDPEPSATTTSGDTTADTGFPVWAIWLIVLGVLLVAAIVVIIVLAARRRSGPSAP
jgi:hypothetical protein